MTRAEKRAIEAYPDAQPYDSYTIGKRIGYREGYAQAEKDLMADAIETTIDGKVVKVIVIDE